MYNIYGGADSSKMLTEGISTCPEVKNIVLLNNNVNISMFSSELQVYTRTSVVNGLPLSTRSALTFTRAVNVINAVVYPSFFIV